MQPNNCNLILLNSAADHIKMLLSLYLTKYFARAFHTEHPLI
jgi:hypothetical protein